MFDISFTNIMYICIIINLKYFIMKTKINFLFYFSFGLGLIFLSSCASLTGYQDGRSIGEGNGEAMISINGSQTPSFGDIDDGTNTIEIPTFIYPNIEIGGRYGVTEKLDVTLRMNTSLNLGIGAKYQLAGDRTTKYAVGTGLELGTFGLVSGLWNAQVPLYLSLHPTEKFSFYLSPRYILQFATIGELGGWNYLGGNTGILFGSKHKFGIDVGFYSVGATDVDRINLITAGIGGKFAFGDNFPTSTGSTSKTKKKRKR